MMREVEERLTAVEQIAQECGCTPTAVALACLLAQSGVTAPILGGRSVKPLGASLQALTVKVTPGQVPHLNAASTWEGGR